MVETIRLESGHTLTGIVGSNPTLSAILLSFDRPCPVVLTQLESQPQRKLPDAGSRPAEAAGRSYLPKSWT